MSRWEADFHIYCPLPERKEKKKISEFIPTSQKLVYIIPKTKASPLQMICQLFDSCSVKNL